MSERVKAIRITNPDTIAIVERLVNAANAKTYTRVAERLIHERAMQIESEKKDEQPTAATAGAV